MKIEEKDNKLIVFLNKKNKKDFNFKDKIKLEKKFQSLFLKLKKIYNLETSGTYDIEIYIIEKYGLILEIEKQEEYINYCDYVDMNIKISKYNEIIYKLKNYEKNIINSSTIYVYSDELYIVPKKNEFQLIGQIIENSEIIYGKEAKNIKAKAKKISPNMLNVEKI